MQADGQGRQLQVTRHRAAERITHQFFAAGTLVLVGYELREDIPGGGRFVFRNSWGTDWAAQGHFGPGYGTLFFDYLRNYGLEAFA